MTELPATPEPTHPAHVASIRALRVVCPDEETYRATVNLYTSILGIQEDGRFGSPEDPVQSSVFRLPDGVDLIVCREDEPLPEAYIDQGTVWVCLATDDADALHAEAQERGADLLNQPLDTAFGTRAFYANDPDGRPIYVGAPWARPRRDD